MKRILLLIVFVILSVYCFSQSIVYVDSAATGANNGTSWENAYRYLSSALKAADVNNTIDTIFVAKGTYYPTGDKHATNRDSSFLILRSNISLFGGFDPANGISDISQRNFPKYGGSGTILSGNINNQSDSLDNSWHVMIIASFGNDRGKILLDGITVRESNGTMSPGGYKYYKGIGGPYSYYGIGGGMLITSPNTTVTILNSRISNNVYQGIHSRATLRMDNCSVISNFTPGGDANSSTYIVYSGCGIYCLQTLDISNSLVSGNQIYYSANSRGAGMYVEGGLKASNCEITNNSILDIANCSPLIGSGGGAGIYATGNHALIKNCIITGNTVTITKPCVWDNELRAYRYGGGGGIGLSTSADIINTVIANNSVSGANNAPDLAYQFGGGGIFMMENMKLNLVNSVLYGNSAVNGAAIASLSKNQNWPIAISNSIILNHSNVFPSNLTPTIYSSLIQGNTSTANGNLNGVSPGPVFINPAAWDFRLLAGSACINAGDNNFYRNASYGNVDVLGNNRISGGRIDIGAAEYGSAAALVPNVLYVDGSIPVSGNGSSWANAFKHLSDALVYANDNSTVDSILVARGTYYATGAQTGTDRNSTFLVKYGGLKIFGGFPAGGGSFADRVLPDVSGAASGLYSVLSGDILTAADSTDNSYHLMVVTKIPSYADSIVVDGFCFNNGNANALSGTNFTYNAQSVYQYAGAAVMIWDVQNEGKLLFRHCQFNNNSARGWAAAVFNQDAKADFQKVRFYNNVSQTSDGGAVFNTGAMSEMRFTECRFENNMAKAGTGGALFNHSNAALYFTKPLFAGNVAASRGGAIFNDQGTRTEIVNGLFYQNRSNTHDLAGVGGAAVQVNNAAFTGINCTFYGHHTGSGLYGFMTGTGGGSIVLKNSVATHNPASGGVAVSGGTTYSQSYSLIQDQNYTTDQNLNYSTTPLINLYVNSADPDGPDGVWLTADDGLRPTLASPVREEGNNDFVIGVNTDIAGNKRVMGCNVDMGAYEMESPKMILHVDAANGNDNNNGLAWNTAHKTLGKALELANTLNCVDTILVASGTYYATGNQIAGAPDFTQRATTFNIARGGIKLYGGFQPGGTGGWAARQLPATGNGSVLSGDISSTHDSSYNSIHVMLIAGIPAATDSIVVDGFSFTAGTANLLSYRQWNGVNVHQGEGAGLIMSEIPATTTIRNCMFTRNYAATWGAAMVIRNGSPSIINCHFNNNTGVTSGGAFAIIASDARVTNCKFFSNRTLDETDGGASGGAIIGHTSNAVLTNCSMVNNSCPGDGGAVYFYNSPGNVMINCILWGNHAAASPAIFTRSAAVTVSNSIIEGGYEGAGNLNTDPLFENELTGDLRLTACSPGINSGVNTAIPDGISTDLAGNLRLQLGKVDMGVYESTASISTAALPSSNAAVSNFQASNGSTEYADQCHQILTVVSGDQSPSSVSGNTTARLWIETSQPAGFVKRHYEITPDNFAEAATGRVTLFFTQTEFDDFNAVNVQKLPENAGDDAGKTRLLIEKRPGVSSNGTGLPGSYSGTAVSIDPDDADILWNAVAGRWEVSFDVTGFSGFFVKTQPQVLPLQLISFTGNRQQNINQLVWQTADEYNVSHFEIERSNDASHYSVIASVNALNGQSQQYRLNDTIQFTGSIFYRLKMMDRDGQFKYSNLVRLQSKGSSSFSIYPNPANDRLWIETGNGILTGSEAFVMDASGKIVQGFRILQLKQPLYVNSLKSGVYFIRFANGEVLKFIKE